MDEIIDKVAPAAVKEYDGLAKKHGADAVGTLRFAVPESQSCRFDAVLRLARIALEGAQEPIALLDVGCGLGDILPRLEELDQSGERLRVHPFYYLGVDPAPAVIEVARKKYADRSWARFEVGTVFDVPTLMGATGSGEWAGPRFDLVFGIGCFGEREPSWPHGRQLRMVQRSFEEMYRLAGKVAVMTAHSTYKQNPRPIEFLVDPWGFAAWAHDTLTERVVLDHQEMPHEIFVAAYKGPSKWKAAYDRAQK